MWSIGEFFYLPYLKLKAACFNQIEEIKISLRFNHIALFRQLDRELHQSYRNQSPYFLSKRFSEEIGEKDVYTYGETPLTVMDMIAKKIKLSSSDHVFDLGCGRGRCAFFLSSSTGCKVTAVDHNVWFVEKGQTIVKKFPSLPLEFILSDIQEINLDQASVIYLCGTCLSAQVIEELCNRLSHLSSDVKIITVSYPLTDYRPELFSVEDTFTARFSWGKVELFIQHAL